MADPVNCIPSAWLTSTMLPCSSPPEESFRAMLTSNSRRGKLASRTVALSLARLLFLQWIPYMRRTRLHWNSIQNHNIGSVPLSLCRSLPYSSHRNLSLESSILLLVSRDCPGSGSLSISPVLHLGSQELCKLAKTVSIQQVYLQ